MKPYHINFLNALTYISLGSWGYFASDTPSATSLIPVFAGILLIVVTPGLKKGNSIMAHIAVGLTILVLLGLIKPLNGTIGRHDVSGIARVSIMMLTSIVAVLIFIKSFINARR